MESQVEREKESQLTTAQQVQSDSAKGAQASSVAGRRSRRSRLNQDEQQEIARLYVDPSMSTLAICTRLGIGASSLYRIVQRQGVPLRGRTTSLKLPSPLPEPASGTLRHRSSTSGSQVASPPRPTAATIEGRARTRPSGGGPTRRAVDSEPRTPPTGPVIRPAGSIDKQFRIRYRGERVFEAPSIQAALRLAESLGAVDIIGIARED